MVEDVRLNYRLWKTMLWKKSFILIKHLIYNCVTSCRFIGNGQLTSSYKHNPGEPSKYASDYKGLVDAVSRFNWSTVCSLKKALVDFAFSKKLALLKTVSYFCDKFEPQY